MIVTKVKRRYVIVKERVEKLERFRPIEIRLMSNVTRITGIMITTSPTTITLQRLGLVVFQANDESDVFQIAEVLEQGSQLDDVLLVGIDEGQIDTNCAWITGNTTKVKEVNIAGDNVFLKAWLKGEKFDTPYTLRIYIECELAEELVGVVTEGGLDADDKVDLEPLEVNL